VRSFENINEETLKNGYRVMISVRWASITWQIWTVYAAAKQTGKEDEGRMSEIRAALSGGGGGLNSSQKQAITTNYSQNKRQLCKEK
jgi:hypothetical protein